MSKYQQLELYLAKQKIKRIKLEYSQIEKIINGYLPNSAYAHRSWWGNSYSNQSKAWQSAGYYVHWVKQARHVIFKRY